MSVVARKIASNAAYTPSVQSAGRLGESEGSMITDATEIAAGLFLGTREDAVALGAQVPSDWACISVTEYRSRYGRKEELPNEPAGSLDLPFMVDSPTGWHADRFKLDLVAETICLRRLEGKRVLVHCVHGQERSPLAVAWYLAWAGTATSVKQAYERVAHLHERTERRDTWLRGAVPSPQHPRIAELIAASHTTS